MNVCTYYYNNFGKAIENGYYIEIGAFNGVKQNSTIILEHAGWNGVCVEPMPANIKKLRKNRKCRIIEGGIWVENNQMEFADVGIPGWTGIAQTHQDQHKNKYKDGVVKSTINCFRFDSLDFPNKIDYLQIDTEGSELQILGSIDMTKFAIDYICIEDNLGLKGDISYHNFMLNLGYSLVHKQEQDSLYKKI